MRRSGVTFPLFSLRSRTDWGIGEINDLPACAAWLLCAGQRLIQVLPTHALSVGETSPYGAISAFALDPVYISIDAIAELQLVEGDVLDAEGVAELAHLRACPSVQYERVRALKDKALGRAFELFCERELRTDSPRYRAFLAFVQEESAWLADFALFVALREAHGGWGWRTWPERERDRSDDVLALARSPRDDSALGTEILRAMYTQWIAYGQWSGCRDKLRALGVGLMGDMPFVVGVESADVWAHRDLFRLDVSLGAPPDEFSAEGQKWGLPAYDFESMERDDFAWFRMRARHEARLVDRFRMDHVLGFFRQWLYQEVGVGRFDVASEQAQSSRGERILGAIVREVGAGTVIAEDLGVVPTFVREAMARLSLPGYKVIPWEHAATLVPYDPATYPKLSVATWSTHDTQPITQWWYEMTEPERARIATLAKISIDVSEAERERALIELLLSAGSDLSLLLVTELLGDKTRLNWPGTVGEANWSWRLPRPIEDLQSDDDVCDRLRAIRALAESSGRFTEPGT